MEIYNLLALSFLFLIGEADNDNGNVLGNVTYLEVINATSSSVTLFWTEPEPAHIDFNISKYHIEYGVSNSGYWNYKESAANGVNMTFLISGLEPYTNYSFQVRPVNTKGDSSYPGASVNYITDVAEPAAPEVINLICDGDFHMGIQIEQPENYRNSKFTYDIAIKGSGGEMFETERESSMSDKTIYLYVELPNLKRENFYLVSIRASVQSIYQPSTIYYGPFSKEQKLEIGSPCLFVKDVNEIKPEQTSESTLYILAGVISLLIILIAAIIFGIYKCGICRISSRQDRQDHIENEGNREEWIEIQ